MFFITFTAIFSRQTLTATLELPQSQGEITAVPQYDHLNISLVRLRLVARTVSHLHLIVGGQISANYTVSRIVSRELFCVAILQIRTEINTFGSGHHLYEY